MLTLRSKGPRLFLKKPLTKSLLNLELLSEDTLKLILCHEFGHFLGGEPFVHIVNSNPSSIFTFKNPYEGLSTEGQADYFATSSCLTEILPQKSPEEHFAIIEKTIEIYDSINAQFFNIHENYSFETPDPSIVQETIRKAGEYPSLHCRADTMIIGLGNSLSQNSDLYSFKERPSCWFRP